jgi:glycosyltransferase involved in cell wall biosynthesis
MHVPVLTRALSERNYRVGVVCRRGSPLEENLADERFPRLVVAGGDYFAPGTVLSVRNFLRENGFDLVHSHFSRDFWKVVPAVWGLPGVHLIHTRHINSGVKKNDFLHRRLFDRVDSWIATSEDGKANLVETHPVDPDRVHVVPLGIALSVGESGAATSEKWRRELSISQDALIVGMLGRLTPNKGHRVLLKAIPKIVEKIGDEVVFLIVGGPSVGEERYGDSLVEKAREMNIEERVRFTGPMVEISSLLSLMDIYVMPSHKESFGLSLLEAMAHRLPVVVTAAGGPLEVIEDDVSGFLIPPRDPDRLADAVVRLANDSELRRRLGDGARRRVEENFSEEKMVDGILSVYRSVSGRSER